MVAAILISFEIWLRGFTAFQVTKLMFDVVAERVNIIASVCVLIMANRPRTKQYEATWQPCKD